MNSADRDGLFSPIKKGWPTRVDYPFPVPSLCRNTNSLSTCIILREPVCDGLKVIHLYKIPRMNRASILLVCTEKKRFSLFLSEQIDAHSANRAGPAFRKVLKIHFGRNSVFGIACFGVIDITARIANIFHISPPI